MGWDQLISPCMIFSLDHVWVGRPAIETTLVDSQVFPFRAQNPSHNFDPSCEIWPNRKNPRANLSRHCMTNGNPPNICWHTANVDPLHPLGTLDVEFRHEGHQKDSNSHLTNDTTLYDILYRTWPLIRIIESTFQEYGTLSSTSIRQKDISWHHPCWE